MIAFHSRVGELELYFYDPLSPDDSHSIMGDSDDVIVEEPYRSNHDIPTIPPELIDHILFFLADRKETLRNCCLVCQEWLPWARSYLHRRSELLLRSNPPRDACIEAATAAFQRFCIAGPPLWHCIKEFTIKSAKREYVSGVYPPIGFSIVWPLLKSLPDLEVLVLSQVTLYNDGEETRSPIISNSTRKTLRRLELDDIASDEDEAWIAHHLIGLLASFSHIEQLRVSRFHCSPRLPATYDPLPPLNVKSADFFLGLSRSFSAFLLQWYEASSAHPQILDSLVVALTKAYDIAPFTPLATTLGPHMRNLTLDVFFAIRYSSEVDRSE